MRRFSCLRCRNVVVDFVLLVGYVVLHDGATVGVVARRHTNLQLLYIWVRVGRSGCQAGNVGLAYIVLEWGSLRKNSIRR